MGSKNAEVYDACPYCLTEITLGRNYEIKEEDQKLEVKNIENKQAKMLTIEKEPTPSIPKANECTHHFGYLSKRSTKDKIPEECMVCEKIVQCMLKNVTS